MIAAFGMQGRRTRPAISREAPGPTGVRMLRDLLQMRRNRIALVSRAMREHGDIVRFALGSRRLMLVSDPDAIRHVLVDNPQNYRKGLGLADAEPLLGEGLLTSEGEQWAKHRRAVQAAMQTEGIQHFAAAVSDAAHVTVDRWQSAGMNHVDVGRDMLRLSLRAFTRGMLRVDVEAESEQVLEDFAALGRWALRRSVSLMRMPLRYPGPGSIDARRRIGRLQQLAGRLLDPAFAGSSDGVLRALRALDPLGPAPGHASRDELLTLLLAGHETAGAALAWSLFCLARHPGVAARVRVELETVLGSRDPSPADIPSLPLTRAVLDEACRLYPPVWLLPRKAIAADEIHGCAVAPGADVLLVVYSLHRHPQYWTEPDAFDPDRFLAGGLRAGIYLPFGAGPRVCLGSRLATLEGVVALAVLVRRFSFRTAPIPPVILNPDLTLHFPQGHLFRVADREARNRGEATAAAAF